MLNISFGQQFNKPMVITLGFFDCMHKGHVALYDAARRVADENDCLCALLTFCNNHFKVIGMDVKPIYTFEERLAIYKNVGLDVVVSATFDKQFMNLSADDFLQVLSSYNLKHVVCGFDYTCGRDRKDSLYVKNYFSQLGIGCTIVEEVLTEGEKISSTLIRKLLMQNNVEKANTLLSQPYFVTGVVEDGRKVGRSISFPTANLKISDEKLLPVGVYGGKTIVDGKQYNAIVNIGAKPTFNLLQNSVEAHLVGFSGDLYGKPLTVELTKFLRGVKKFENKEQLAEQLKFDLECVAND
jgi:riboflavin kinase/FMN adenylyltransferase